MPTLESSIEIDATPDALWRLTQDYDHRLDWDPFLGEARLVGGATEVKVGVRAWCATRSGMGMETEYVSARPGRVAAVKMTKGPWILGKFAGAWLFKPAGARTRVVFRYHIRARILRWMLDPILVWWFRRETDQRLRALKAAVERR